MEEDDKKEYERDEMKKGKRKEQTKPQRNYPLDLMVMDVRMFDSNGYDYIICTMWRDGIGTNKKLTCGACHRALKIANDK